MRKNSGFSLLEVMIGTLILSVVILITMRVLFTSSTLATRGSRASDLEARGRKLVDDCKLDFLTAKFTDTAATTTAPADPVIVISGTSLAKGIYSNNTEIRYRVPSGHDTATGGMKYGYTSPRPKDTTTTTNNGVVRYLACVLRFEAEEGLRESSAATAATQSTSSLPVALFPFPTLTNSVVNIDINRDGDKNDTFVRGKIIRYYVFDQTMIGSANWPAGATSLTPHANPLSSEVLADNVVLAGNGAGIFNGDMDNDGVQDYLFQFRLQDGTGTTNATLTTSGSGGAKEIRINAWIGTYDENNKKFMLRQTTDVVRFRNPQS